jgi:YbbR domain-containing protein
VDKLMDNRWFLRITALLLAILLYASVNVDDTTLQGNINDRSNGSAVTIDDIPVEIYYDSENLVVTGVPETVSITIDGPKNVVQTTKAQKDFHVYVDLRDVKVGSHKVPIKIKNISSKLTTVKINPAYANVTIQDKITKEFSVQPEFNDALLAKGYELESIEVDPKTVNITGSKDQLDKITFVKATLNVDEKIDGAISKQAQVRVLDSELNKLDVSVDPNTVNVRVSVNNPSKEVRVKIKETGKSPDGTKVDSLKVTPKTVTVFGKESLLRALEEATVEVDLSTLKEDATLELPIKLPEGINKSTPDRVQVEVKVTSVKKDETASNETPPSATPEDTGGETPATNNGDGSNPSPDPTTPVPDPSEGDQATSRTITGVTVSYKNLADKLTMDFLSPRSGTVEFLVSGSSKEIEDLKASDFSAYVNLSSLKEGEHNVPIVASGPDQVKWSLKVSNATVKLTNKEAVANSSADTNQSNTSNSSSAD